MAEFTNATTSAIIPLNGPVLTCVGGAPTGKISRGFVWKKAAVAGGSAASAFGGSSQALMLEHLPQARGIVLTRTAAETAIDDPGSGGGYSFLLFPSGGTAPASSVAGTSGISICHLRRPAGGSSPLVWCVHVNNMLGVNIIEDQLFANQLDTVYDLQINFLSAVSFQTVINGVFKTYTIPSGTFPAGTYFRMSSRVCSTAFSGVYGLWCRYAKLASAVIA